MTESTRITGTRFGDLDIPADNVLDLPEGLIGIPGTAYGVLAVGDGGFRWLQSLEDPSFALPVCEPSAILGDIDIQLSAEDQERIGLASAAEALVWTTIRVTPEGEWMTNLRAPIVIVDGKGWQLINQAPGAPLRAALPVRSAVAA